MSIDVKKPAQPPSRDFQSDLKANIGNALANLKTSSSSKSQSDSTSGKIAFGDGLRANIGDFVQVKYYTLKLMKI